VWWIGASRARGRGRSWLVVELVVEGLMGGGEGVRVCDCVAVRGDLGEGRHDAADGFDPLLLFGGFE